jgi:hypothetical protein
MKKIIPIIFSFFVCICFAFPVNAFAYENDPNDPSTWTTEFTIDQIWNYINNSMQSGETANAQNAETNQKMDELNKKVEEMDPEKAIKDYFDEVKENDTPEVINPNVDEYKVPAGSIANKILAIPRSMAKVASFILDAEKGMIMLGDPSTNTYIGQQLGANTISYGINISTIEEDDQPLGKLVNPIRIFAYSLVLLFFAVNLVEQTIKYEIFTAKGALRIFGRLLVAKIIIDLSVKVCMLIISIIGSLTLKMLDNVNVTMDIYPEFTLEKSGVKIIGPILDAVAAAAISLVLVIVIGVVLVCVSIVMIKLVLRSIELAMLIVVSPAFFACLSSDVTKEYFKKFISVFIQVASQTLFMAIAMAVCSSHLNTKSKITIDNFGELSKALINISPTILVVVAMCVMMIKPPKVLTGLVK